MTTTRIIVDDALSALQKLESESVHCIITSPPYWRLRSYNEDAGMIGQEATFEEHLERLLAVFEQVRRVLRNDGCFFLNYGDAYDRKTKQLMMMPAKIALALQANEWQLRSEIVWAKKNPIPESIRNRPTSSHEKIFMFTKSDRYYYDHIAAQIERLSKVWPGIGKQHATTRKRNEKQQNMRVNRGVNLRNVLHVATQAFDGAHFAVMPTSIVEPWIKAATSYNGCCAECETPHVRLTRSEYKRHDKWFGAKQSVRNSRGKADKSYNELISTETIGWRRNCDCDTSEVKPCTVLDPFAGAGTVALVAARLGRNSILIEISQEYAELTQSRLQADNPLIKTNIEIEMQT